MITDAQSYIKLVFTGVGNYTYSMVCRDEAHLSVYHIDSEGSTTKLLISQYSITLGIGGAGGTVAVSDSALASGFLFIRREVPLAQTINLTNSSRLDMELLERGLDTNVMLIQQIRDYVATSTVDIPWRGVWSGPDVSYIIRDLAVAPDGDWYICQAAHTSSASFSTDLTAGKWILWIPMSSYADVTTRVTELETNLAYNESNDTFDIDITGNAATATTAGACIGNAATATSLATAKTIGGVAFNGTANIDLPGVNVAGNQNTSGNAATATIAASCYGNAATATIAAACSGNAATATNALSLGGSPANAYARNADPTFTGVPSAPTASVGTNSTQIATTAFVKANSVGVDHGYSGVGAICACCSIISSSNPLPPGGTIAGSNITPCSVNAGDGIRYHGTALSGTWRILGYYDATPSRFLSIFQRIA